VEVQQLVRHHSVGHWNAIQSLHFLQTLQRSCVHLLGAGFFLREVSGSFEFILRLVAFERSSKLLEIPQNVALARSRRHDVKAAHVIAGNATFYLLFEPGIGSVLGNVFRFVDRAALPFRALGIQQLFDYVLLLS